MSLRSEYSWVLEYKPALGWSLWVYWIHSGHPVKGMIMPLDLVESDDWLELCEREANRLIRAHMEKVTQELANGAPRNYEQEEENDRLAHRGDQQQQLEQDLS